MKHVIIAGGSGFIGAALTNTLRERGDRVTIISRTPGKDRITWDELRKNGLPNCDAVLNLAGEHILNLSRRWDDQYRNDLIASRVETTKSLVNAINAMPNPPEVFISSAGKCFYGTKESGENAPLPELDEYSKPMGNDYPSEIVSLWENAADGIDKNKVRHVKVRIGVVLGDIERKSKFGKLFRIGRSRGFLPIIRIPFCLGFGAIIGKGDQPFPWVHIDDMVGILIYLIDHKELTGVYNAVAPEVITNRILTLEFAKRLHRRVFFTIPDRVVKWIVGEERSSILLKGQVVKPRRTLEAGYVFKYPTIAKALDNLVKVTF